jgi:hypothetical protein
MQAGSNELRRKSGGKALRPLGLILLRNKSRREDE